MIITLPNDELPILSKSRNPKLLYFSLGLALAYPEEKQPLNGLS